ncbi:MAG: hypothetical protein KL863_22985 [Rhizobium sp.]|jgi:hypothetical protein|nr:hypothetical protein [Rhizobium sp.]
MDTHELEARLNAHREVLISLMASMIAGGRHARVFEDLHQDAVFRDGEEDPGIVPSKAFASEAHGAEEIARLLEAARARAAHL